MALKHSDKDICDLCEAKLKEAHPYLQDWFRRLKKRHESVHVSCAWRNAEDQAKAVLSGASDAYWPNSKHNHTENNVPCSLALDIFQIDQDGVARWSWKFYEMVNKENKDSNEPIKWGGTFKVKRRGKLVPLQDGPHFQYEGS